jgi:2,4-dienoyl-CoA reductase-like NADH-dependent reductase (Old Yellow Enzyme family)
MPATLFTPITLGGVTLPNRIVVSPMCQYSADDGSMNDWHFVHLGHLAYSGAGLVMVEATHVTREGRITHGCTGLYSDHNEASIKKVIDACRRVSKSPFGIQIGHAGRKASTQVPWEGREALGPQESPWPTLAPSPLPFSETWHTPKEMSKEEILRTVHAFVASDRRSDEYGRERMKFALQVARAVRETWPKERGLGARISANDWAEGGLGPDDAVTYARELERVGFDYVCVSSGGLVSHARLNVGPGYQLPFAERVKKNCNLKVRAVGMIADPEQAEAAIAEGKADMVAMARAFLDNPRWVWHAAERFGVKLDYPPQYARARHDAWPGSKLARPPSKAS